jgi:hypothetical protein
MYPITTQMLHEYVMLPQTKILPKTIKETMITCMFRTTQILSNVKEMALESFPRQRVSTGILR